MKQINLLQKFQRGLMMAGILVMFSGKTLFSQTTHGDYSFAFEKSGKGRAMILIPGLFCSGKVWDETVAHFKDRYECYEITLPGFAGQPAIQSDSFLKTVSVQIANFIIQHKLEKPIIVGHSLGGFIALQIATLYPDLPGGLVIVSSSPFLPALMMSPDISPDSTRKIGLQIKNSMKNLTPAQIGQYEKFSLPTMIRDSARFSLVESMATNSDPVTQGESMYELFSIDLRPGMKNIYCPVLVMGDWSSYRKYGATRESVLKNYTQQFSLAKNVTIAINDSSYHFIMYDEPQWFFQQIEGFIVKG
jgi:N-formylmaleamate deformylase